jgi:hypothetical protein
MLTPDNKSAGDPLEGVAFASPTAKARAEQLGLTAANFANREPSGKTGFNARDVEAAGSEEHGE